MLHVQYRLQCVVLRLIPPPPPRGLSHRTVLHLDLCCTLLPIRLFLLGPLVVRPPSPFQAPVALGLPCQLSWFLFRSHSFHRFLSFLCWHSCLCHPHRRSFLRALIFSSPSRCMSEGRRPPPPPFFSLTCRLCELPKGFTRCWVRLCWRFRPLISFLLFLPRYLHDSYDRICEPATPHFVFRLLFSASSPASDNSGRLFSTSCLNHFLPLCTRHN